MPQKDKDTRAPGEIGKKERMKESYVEADNSETDMLVLAEKSYRYLVDQGLGN